jgi:hypothetical protein
MCDEPVRFSEWPEILALPLQPTPSYVRLDTGSDGTVKRMRN